MSRRTFEESGLGKAPFKFLGVHVNPSKSLQEHNPEAFNNAVRMAPQLSIGGTWTCAHCGAGIMNAYIIKSADGQTSAVGESCINKIVATNKEGALSELERAVKKYKREQNRKAREARRLSRIAEIDELMREPKVLESLKAAPHSSRYWASQGKTLEDELNCLKLWAGHQKRVLEILNAIKKFGEAV